MSTIQETNMMSWHPKETHAYAKESRSPQGFIGPEYVRIYASQQDVSSSGCGDPNCLKQQSDPGYVRMYASSCDLYNNVNTNSYQNKPNGTHQNGRPALTVPSVTSFSKQQESNQHLSPNHLTLEVPHDERRCSSQMSCHSGDSVVSLGLPTTYPPQPSIHGSMSCLSAEIPLNHIDFWPACRKKALMACDAKFETFDALVRKANKWLEQFNTYELVSCETVDKKIIYVKDIYSAAMYFTDEEVPVLATHIKGLRIWYRNTPGTCPTSTQELGFQDTTPCYLNPGEKHPIFETLPETIDKINRRLVKKPLSGRVINVETVSLKIARDDWSDNIRLDPCECVTDFTPDTLDEGGIFHPAKYTPFTELFKRVSEWIRNKPTIHVTNIQSLDTKHRKKSENHGHRFNTDKMFEYRIEERFRAFFIRLGYVIHTDVSPQDFGPQLQCRMYLPYKKITGYENITEILQRVEIAIEDTGARVYHVETVPMPEWITKPELCEKGERTFFDGEWYFVADQDGNDRGPYRYTLIYAIRVYYEGLPADYGIPRKPSTSKKNCCCIL